MLLTIKAVSRSQKRPDTALTCGDTSTRGWLQKGCPTGSGSVPNTSSAAPRTRRSSSSSSSAGSSSSEPRDTLMTSAWCGSRSSTRRSTAPTVSAVCGAAMTSTSLPAASRGKSAKPPTHSTPLASPGPPLRSGRRRTPATFIPSDSPRRATAVPMPPSPKTPSRSSRNSRIGIGTAVARRGLSLGMKVAGVRRRPERSGGPGEAKGVEWVGGLADLPRLAAGSDVLVIAAPHTAETVGAVDRRVLERLPHHALVINVSRGSLLDEPALLELLELRRVRGAALDVFGTEPLPVGHPFWSHPRVLVSPHVSAVSGRFWERETALIVSNISSYLAGAPLTNLVDREAGY